MVLSGTIGADWVHFGELWFVWVQSGLFGYVRFKTGQNGQTRFLCAARTRLDVSTALRYAQHDGRHTYATKNIHRHPEMSLLDRPTKDPAAGALLT